MTVRISHMHNIPDWLWNEWDTPDWYWQGLAVGATFWATTEAIKWARNHREEAGEIYNYLRYRLGESAAPVTETVDTLSLKAGFSQLQEIVTISGRSGGAGGGTVNVEAVRKNLRTKHELYRIADTVLYYFFT